MSEDGVILLSSDESESDAFVTPHKATASPRSRLGGADTNADDDDDDDNDFLGQRLQSRLSALSAAAVGQTATPSNAVARPPGPRGDADVLFIDDTPIHVSSNSARSRRPEEARGLGVAASGFSAFSSDDLQASPFPDLPVSSKSLAPPSRPSRVFSDSFDDDDDFGIVHPRPSKRPKLSPRADARIAAATIASSPQFTMDDSDNEMHGINSPKPVLPILPKKSQEGQPPKATAECIDLLSSSDSETGHNSPKKIADKAEPEFVDIDDLLVAPAPPKKASAPPSAHTHRREPSAEIMLLSSSSPARPSKTTATAMTRETSLPGRVSVQSANAPQVRKPMKRSFSEGHALAFDDDEDGFDVWEGGLPSDAHVSHGVEDLLAAWRKDLPPKAPSQPLSSSRQHHVLTSGRRSSSDETGNSSGPATAKLRPGPSSKQTVSTESADMADAGKEARRREQETLREEKRRGKEAEKERRQREKEVEKERRKINADMAREKKAHERAQAAAFNDANRSRVDKTVAAPEMIVRLPMALPQATKEITEGLLSEIKSKSEMWRSPLLDNIVTWRRKVSAEYKPDLGHWVPVQEHIVDEKLAMAVFRAEDLVKLILAAQDPDVKHQVGGYDLESHLRAMKRAFPRHTIIYLVEGLHAWKSKNRTLRNRQFADAVRNAGGNGSTSSSAGGTSTPAGAAAAAALSRSRQPGQTDEPTASAADTAAARPSHRLGRRGQKQAPQHLDEAVVDDAILELQMGFDDDDDDDSDDDNDNGNTNDDDGGDQKTRIMVHETQSSLDTARWIKIFTEQIATGRYRRLKEELYAASASFCMDSGQIATGDGGSETYVLMLQQIARVTEPVALGVAARYGTLPKLVRGFRDEGPLALEGCLKSRNRNGALSDRTVGQALSRRIYKVFMGHDAASTDV